jgi:ketosteroid isomerase-like protein
MQPSVSTVRAKLHGDLAYLVQRCSNAVRMPNGTSVTVTGNSLAIFARQEDGSWKIQELVVNRDPKSQ